MIDLFLQNSKEFNIDLHKLSKDQNFTPFIHACIGWGCNANILDFMLSRANEFKLDINYRISSSDEDSSFVTAFYYALENHLRPSEVVKTFIKHSKNVKLENSEANMLYNIFSMLLPKGYIEACDLILDNTAALGININVRDDSGKTCLHLAAMIGDYDVAYMLLNHEGTDFTVKDHEDKTALDHAKELNEIVIVDLIESVMESRIKFRF